jgi:hypothetical protein
MRGHSTDPEPNFVRWESSSHWPYRLHGLPHGFGLASWVRFDDEFFLISQFIGVFCKFVLVFRKQSFA